MATPEKAARSAAGGLLTCTAVEEIRRLVLRARAAGRVIGIVPTMGALHEGHARLIEACRNEAACVVVSIFVNPTQFGPGEDFERYPRALGDDALLCAQSGASAIFEPSIETMYPFGSEATVVDVPGLADVLEGNRRPGHFRGVGTVVMKLFHMVGPDVAYFGEKDYQQLLVIKRMVTDLAMPALIRSIATVREPDGLAMSSRNRYLNGAERRAATVLKRALDEAAKAVGAGERHADRVRQILSETVKSESLARLDYAEVADAATLEPLADLEAGRPAVALLAAWVGPARLIDNAQLAV
jgi:pantoate--beta-alanine ligase